MIQQPRFHLGWDPRREAEARRSGPFASMVRSSAAAARGLMAVQLPQSFSLLKFRQFPFDQGQAGTCFANAATQLMQVHTAVESIVNGKPWEVAQLSRRFGGYYGKVVEGGGNPDDGGTIADALTAMSDDRQWGKGTCHEDLWPYPGGDETAMRISLAMEPPDDAIADAANNRVSEITDIPTTLGDDAKAMIFAGHPIGIGIWWPSYWDTVGANAFDGIGSSGSYGHAVLIIGWAVLDGKHYWQIDNSHGPIYRPLSARYAATIPGYTPTLESRYGFEGTNDFWVIDAALLHVLSFAGGVATTAASITGFYAKPDILSFSEFL